MIVTVAGSLSETGTPSLSSPLTVAVLVKISPALPVTVSVKEHVYVSPGRIVKGPASEQLPLPSRLPKVSVVRLVMVSGSVGSELFLILTVYVTLSPGAKIVDGSTS
jgi:hypothetical protein